MSSIQPFEKLPAAIFDVFHQLASPAVIRPGAGDAVDYLQLLNILGEFLCEIIPTAVSYVFLPLADVFVSVMVAHDMFFHPCRIQSRFIDYAVQAVPNSGVA